MVLPCTQGFLQEDNSDCQQSIEGVAPQSTAQNGEKGKELQCQELLGECSLSFLA